MLAELEEKIVKILAEKAEDEWDAEDDASLIAHRISLLLDGELVVYDPRGENHVVFNSEEEAIEVAEKIAEVIREVTGLAAEVVDGAVVVRFQPEFERERKEKEEAPEEVERRLEEVL